MSAWKGIENSKNEIHGRFDHRSRCIEVPSAYTQLGCCGRSTVLYHHLDGENDATYETCSVALPPQKSPCLYACMAQVNLFWGSDYFCSWPRIHHGICYYGVAYRSRCPHFAIGVLASLDNKGVQKHLRTSNRPLSSTQQLSHCSKPHRLSDHKLASSGLHGSFHRHHHSSIHVSHPSPPPSGPRHFLPNNNWAIFEPFFAGFSPCAGPSDFPAFLFPYLSGPRPIMPSATGTVPLSARCCSTEAPSCLRIGPGPED